MGAALVLLLLLQQRQRRLHLCRYRLVCRISCRARRVVLFYTNPCREFLVNRQLNVLDFAMSLLLLLLCSDVRVVDDSDVLGNRQWCRWMPRKKETQQ